MNGMINTLIFIVLWKKTHYTHRLKLNCLYEVAYEYDVIFILKKSFSNKQERIEYLMHFMCLTEKFHRNWMDPCLC